MHTLVFSDLTMHIPSDSPSLEELSKLTRTKSLRCGMPSWYFSFPAPANMRRWRDRVKRGARSRNGFALRRAKTRSRGSGGMPPPTLVCTCPEGPGEPREDVGIVLRIEPTPKHWNCVIPFRHQACKLPLSTSCVNQRRNIYYRHSNEQWVLKAYFSGHKHWSQYLHLSRVRVPSWLPQKAFIWCLAYYAHTGELAMLDSICYELQEAATTYTAEIYMRPIERNSQRCLIQLHTASRLYNGYVKEKPYLRAVRKTSWWYLTLPCRKY